MATVPNAVEILPKISTAWVGRTSVPDDRRQTDGRAIAFSEREREVARNRLNAVIMQNYEHVRVVYSISRRHADKKVFSHIDPTVTKKQLN